MNDPDTDYLSFHLRDDKTAQMEVFQEMLHELERVGECRVVYHRLAYVLFGNTLGEFEVEK